MDHRLRHASPTSGARSDRVDQEVRMRAKQRAALPASKVVYPKSSRVGGKGRNAYPIDTPRRARAALSYAARAKTAGSYRTVEKAVNRRYPSITTRHHRGGGKR